MVVSRLRAALEEERQALLGQAEALRLAIDDEHDHRGRVARPAPSLTSLLELKKALQSVLSATDSSAALKAEEKGASHNRGELRRMRRFRRSAPKSKCAEWLRIYVPWRVLRVRVKKLYSVHCAARDIFVFSCARGS